jgi:hypothetical protein
VAEDTGPTLEVSVVIPCLNEAETVAPCVARAVASLRALAIDGEVIVADNGSTDGSAALAARQGARVVSVPERGYGHALRAGIAEAHGRYVIIGDADGSYDFGGLEPFVTRLRDGADLVMGNRFAGEIKPGAMPWSHRLLGNPVLSAVGRLFFRSPVGDFHCGLRGFRKAALNDLDLRTTGMEFASEMVIKSTLHGQRIVEVPITLSPDGRSRPGHLRTWRDGWRHLRFMLLFSPLWLFAIPGAALFGGGLAGVVWLVPGPRHVGPVEFDVHTLLVSSTFCLVGHQLLVFGAFTKQFAIAEGFHPPLALFRRLSTVPALETGVVVGLGCLIGGGVWLGHAVAGWRAFGFGNLDPRVTMRSVIPGVLLLMLGVQTVFASFFLGILGLKKA